MPYPSVFRLIAKKEERSYGHIPNILKRLRREPRDGFHASRIFFHHFTAGEMRREVSPYFAVEEVHPLEIRIPLVHRVFRDKVRFSRALEHIPVVNLFGEWLILKGHRV